MRDPFSESHLDDISLHDHLSSRARHRGRCSGDFDEGQAIAREQRELTTMVFPSISSTAVIGLWLMLSDMPIWARWLGLVLTGVGAIGGGTSAYLLYRQRQARLRKQHLSDISDSMVALLDRAKFANDFGRDFFGQLATPSDVDEALALVVKRGVLERHGDRWHRKS